MLYLETLVNLARFQKWEREEAVRSRKKSFGRSSIDPRPFLYIEKQIGTPVGMNERDRIAFPDLNDVFQDPLRICNACSTEFMES